MYIKKNYIIKSQTMFHFPFNENDIERNLILNKCIESDNINDEINILLYFVKKEIIKISLTSSCCVMEKK